MKKKYYYSEEYDLLLVVLPSEILKYNLKSRELWHMHPTTIDPDNFKKITKKEFLKLLSENDFF
jgi:hypothetical protein